MHDVEENHSVVENEPKTSRCSRYNITMKLVLRRRGLSERI